MSWIPPVSKNLVKYGVKYGPQAKIIWSATHKHVQSFAKTQVENHAANHNALAEADSVVEGAVLRRVWKGKPVWVVFSGDKPISAYPPLSVDLSALVADADLSKRQTPEQYRKAQLRARAKRTAKRARSATQKAGKVGKDAGLTAARRTLKRGRPPRQDGSGGPRASDE